MVTGSRPSSARHDVEAVLKPDPRRFAPRILSWMICWPWDMLWELIANNPVQLVLVALATEIRAGLDEITQREFKAIEDDLALESELPKPPVAPATPAVVADRMVATVRAESVTATAPTLPSQPVMQSALATPYAPTTPVPEDDPWYAPSQTTGKDDATSSDRPVWTPPQYRVFGQTSNN